MVGDWLPRADRARPNAQQPALQLPRDAPTDPKVDGSGLSDHRGEVAAREIRVLCVYRHRHRLCWRFVRTGAGYGVGHGVVREQVAYQGIRSVEAACLTRVEPRARSSLSRA